MFAISASCSFAEYLVDSKVYMTCSTMLSGQDAPEVSTIRIFVLEGMKSAVCFITLWW